MDPWRFCLTMKKEERNMSSVGEPQLHCISHYAIYCCYHLRHLPSKCKLAYARVGDYWTVRSVEILNCFSSLGMSRMDYQSHQGQLRSISISKQVPWGNKWKSRPEVTSARTQGSRWSGDQLDLCCSIASGQVVHCVHWCILILRVLKHIVLQYHIG